METFDQKISRLKALAADEYSYHADLLRGLKEALEVIDGLTEQDDHGK